jgi:transcriptional regulator with XRE-family HTH domain
MARTPKRAGRVAQPGSLFLSEVVARNLRNYRALRRLTQDDVAAVLDQLGHRWTAGIVGFVERGDRTVAIDELAGLAVALGVSVAALLDPRGPVGSLGPAVDVGGQLTIPPPLARDFISGPQPDDERARHIAALAGTPNPINTREDT